MGCTESEVVTKESLKSELMRVKFACEVRRNRRKDQLKKGQKLLNLEFIKPQPNRNKAVQRATIMGNARVLNQQNLYFLVENEAKIVLERAGLLENPKDLQTVKPSLNIILFCSTFMKFEELQNFAYLFKRKYHDFPFPREKQINNDLVIDQYHENLTFKSEIEYIFQFSLNYQVSMQTINSIGHNYKYGAEKYDG